MKAKKLFSLLAAVLLIFSLTACGKEKSSGSSEKSEGGGKGDVSGEITVIIQRTDIVDTVFNDIYAKKFNEKYPNVKVHFEALADYGGQITPRMNTEDYGDVLLIPTQIPIKDIPDFFEPLGSLEEMSEKYMGVEERAVDGTVYGIPIAMNYTGIIYNKKVFEEAGITKIPGTIDEFMDALRKIKENTDAIPLYTNYAAGWPLTQWEGTITTVAGDPDYYNVKMIHEDNVWDPGTPHYELYKVLYDVVKNKLVEKDPLTTDWETSKAMLARGEIATMVLGSWAIPQIKQFADNPDDIGFMPFPTNAEKKYLALGADFNMAINKHSKHKEAAKAFLNWFIEESGYAVEYAGGISAAKSVPLPKDLDQLVKDYGLELVLMTPAKPGEEGLVDKLDKEAEIGFWLEDQKKRIVEAAMGNRKESYDDIAKDLSERWNKARDKIMKE